MLEYIILDEFLSEEAKESADAQGHLHELVRCKDCMSFTSGEDPDCFVCNNPISPCYQREVGENDYCRHGKDVEQEAQRDYEQSVEYAQYCERYEPTYNPEDGSM